MERARLLIETADALGEPLQDPLLSFSVLYGYWVVNYVAFNGDVMLALAQQFLDRAERQGVSASSRAKLAGEPHAAVIRETEFYGVESSR